MPNHGSRPARHLVRRPSPTSLPLPAALPAVFILILAGFVLAGAGMKHLVDGAAAAHVSEGGRQGGRATGRAGPQPLQRPLGAAERVRVCVSACLALWPQQGNLWDEMYYVLRLAISQVIAARSGVTRRGHARPKAAGRTLLPGPCSDPAAPTSHLTVSSLPLLPLLAPPMKDLPDPDVLSPDRGAAALRELFGVLVASLGLAAFALVLALVEQASQGREGEGRAGRAATQPGRFGEGSRRQGGAV